MDKSEEQNIRLWAHTLGIGLSTSQIHLLGIYLDELCEWNKKINLTGLSSRLRIVRELLLDSLIPLPFLPEEGRLLDIGSGAGFPGIPLKICRPRLKTHFVEANSRKVSFLKQVIRLTGLRKIEVIKGRIEDGEGVLCPQGYHIVTARALAHLSQALTWCAPYLMPEGLLVNFQGSRFEETLKECAVEIQQQGLFLYKCISYSLPGRNSQRNLLIFKRHEK